MSRFPTDSPSDAGNAFVEKGGEKLFDPTRRAHPRFNMMEPHWRFMLESYEGGPAYLFKGLSRAVRPGTASSARASTKRNLFKYFKEGDTEYEDRVARSHRNNYSKKVVDQIRSFVAKKQPERRKEAASEMLRRFWKNVDGNGRPIERFSSSMLQWMEVFGIFWLVVDKPRDLFDNLEDELQEGLPFAKIYFPFDVQDAAFDERGELKWIMVRETERADDDPLAPPTEEPRWILWTRTEFMVLRRVEKKDVKQTFEVVDQGVHDLGFVPARRVAFAESHDPFTAPGMLDDIAYLDRDIYNKQSQLDTIILDQTFSQLVMPTDAVLLNDPDRAEGDSTQVTQQTRAREETRKRLIEMGTKRVFLFASQATHPPRYISPDAEQAGTIREVILDQIKEIYRIAGLLGEVGRETRTQSGVSKAYDFDRLNKVLAYAAKELESAELWMARTAEAWMSIEEDMPEVAEDLVQYPDTFDIMGLLEELDIAVRADEYDLRSPTANAKMRRRVIERLFPNLPMDERETIFEEVEQVLDRELKTHGQAPLDPGADPNMDPGRPSELRGAGGGARGPGAGPPTRPTRQQAGSAERAQDDAT